MKWIPYLSSEPWPGVSSLAGGSGCGSRATAGSFGWWAGLARAPMGSLASMFIALIAQSVVAKEPSLPKTWRTSQPLATSQTLRKQRVGLLPGLHCLCQWLFCNKPQNSSFPHFCLHSQPAWAWAKALQVPNLISNQWKTRSKTTLICENLNSITFVNLNSKSNIGGEGTVEWAMWSSTYEINERKDAISTEAVLTKKNIHVYKKCCKQNLRHQQRGLWSGYAPVLVEYVHKGSRMWNFQKCSRIRPTNQPTKRKIHQPIKQSTHPPNRQRNQPVNHPLNQSTNQPTQPNRTRSNPTNQTRFNPTNQPINQSTTESHNHHPKSYGLADKHAWH